MGPDCGSCRRHSSGSPRAAAATAWQVTRQMADTFDTTEFAVYKADVGRRHWAFRWLGHPYGYAFGVPVLTLLGAGTTLLAPTLLDPTAFGAFVLVTIFFQYSSVTDLGL